MPVLRHEQHLSVHRQTAGKQHLIQLLPRNDTVYDTGDIISPDNRYRQQQGSGIIRIPQPDIFGNGVPVIRLLQMNHCRFRQAGAQDNPAVDGCRSDTIHARQVCVLLDIIRSGPVGFVCKNERSQCPEVDKPGLQPSVGNSLLLSCQISQPVIDLLANNIHQKELQKHYADEDHSSQCRQRAKYMRASRCP